MLETAQNQRIPKYIEMTFHIDQNKSKTFWGDETLKNEHEMLFDEWDNKGDSRYTKKFYGVTYAIQFNHTKL